MFEFNPYEIPFAMICWEMGMNVIPLKPGQKEPLINWKPYQKRRTTTEEMRKWQKDFGDFNIGIVTGQISRGVVIDVDDPAIIPDLKKEIPELETTRSSQTRRGIHYYFQTDKPIRTKYNFLGFNSVELKGEGAYVVAPFSVVNGYRYRFVNFQNEPMYFPKRFIKDDDVVKDFSLPKYYGREVDCIRQILEHDLVEGERDIAFHVCYNLLCQNGNETNYVKKIIKNKNASLNAPLSSKELSFTWKRKYKYKCQTVKEKVPFINCENCKYFEKKLESKKGALRQFKDELRGLNPSAVKMLTFIDTHFEGQLPNPTRLSRVSKVRITNINKYIEELNLKERLPEWK